MDFVLLNLAPAQGATLSQIQTELDTRLGQEDQNLIGVYPVVVTSGAVADGFGAWVELVANVGATPVVIVGVFLHGEHGSEVRRSELELGTGALGAEVTIGQYGYSGQREVSAAGYISEGLYFPVFRRIPANSRVSARIRDDSITAKQYRVSIIYRVGA